MIKSIQRQIIEPKTCLIVFVVFHILRNPNFSSAKMTKTNPLQGQKQSNICSYGFTLGNDQNDEEIKHRLSAGYINDNPHNHTLPPCHEITLPWQKSLPEEREDPENTATLSFVHQYDVFVCALRSRCAYGNPEHKEPGIKRLEFRGFMWHEQCFRCMACNAPIGAGSFIPRGTLSVSQYFSFREISLFVD